MRWFGWGFLLGVVGAAAFYWRFPFLTFIPSIGHVTCPLCPNIDGMGSQLNKILTRTALIGPFNGLLIGGVFWLVSLAIQGRNSGKENAEQSTSHPR